MDDLIKLDSIFIIHSRILSNEKRITTEFDSSRTYLEIIKKKTQGQKELYMISRVWHGWTTLENAEAYESLLRSEIFAGIENQQISGYKGIHLFRRNIGDEVEFITIMWFDSLEAVKSFAGDDYELAVVPPKARALLARFDACSQHYEVRAELKVSHVLLPKKLGG